MKASTGFFIGAEVGYTKDVRNTVIGEVLEDPENINVDGGLSQSTYSIPLNLSFGYQWYFMQNMGLQLKGYVGYANYNSKDGVIFDIINNNPENTTTDEDIRYFSSALHYGAELSYLYDVLRLRNLRLTLSGGLGYQFGRFLRQKIQGASDIDDAVWMLDDYTMSSFSYHFGLYLVYPRHHYFGLNWRFTNGYDRGNTGIYSNNHGDGLIGKIDYKSSPANSLVFSYSYLF